jgi:hypothetical protein
MKKKILNLYEERNMYGPTYQEIFDKNEMLFNVSNLDEFPEDATINRALFSASQYIRAVRYGIKLAKQGYDDVELKREEENV